MSVSLLSVVSSSHVTTVVKAVDLHAGDPRFDSRWWHFKNIQWTFFPPLRKEILPLCSILKFKLSSLNSVEIMSQRQNFYQEYIQKLSGPKSIGPKPKKSQEHSESTEELEIASTPSVVKGSGTIMCPACLCTIVIDFSRLKYVRDTGLLSLGSHRYLKTIIPDFSWPNSKFFPELFVWLMYYYYYFFLWKKSSGLFFFSWPRLYSYLFYARFFLLFLLS